VTAVKDEGAVNSFISKGLVDKMGYTSLVKALNEREEGAFIGMGGTNIPCVGKLCGIPMQIGSINFRID
jgi:hypothetical protein